MKERILQDPRLMLEIVAHCAITCQGETIEVSDLPEYIFGGKREANDLPRDTGEDRTKINVALSMNNFGRKSSGYKQGYVVEKAQIT